MTGISRRGLLAAVSVAGSLTTPQAWGANSHLDADLIRICAEHAINHHAFETSDPDLEDEDNPLYFAFVQTEDIINTAKPLTMDGVMAKARIAKVVATMRGRENPTGSQGGQWGWDIVQDLLRLNGAPA